MNSKLTLFQVDAFTTEPFKGNPAGVCILGKEMPDEWMQNIAAEIHVSETAFVSGSRDNYSIRFFTPESEIPLCGHATLSTAHILYETGIASADEEIKLMSNAGKLTIRSSEGWIIMNFPAYNRVKSGLLGRFEKVVGTRPSELYRTGHGWMLALLKSEGEVRNMKPDLKQMKNSEFGDLIVTAPSDDKNFDFCVRCFAPALGIDEDPVTGSAHCALVPFWHNKTGKNKFLSHQVSKREGILKAELKGNRVEISGQAVTVFKAELLIK
jgi:PhzF family phenazine biosynthesis protein